MVHRMHRQSLEKYKILLRALSRYDKVAVAYSGGVDSTLLLHAAKTALTDPGKVIALTAVSPLSSPCSATGWRTVFNEHFRGVVEHREINLNQLDDEGFVQNDKNRCYLCKKIIYTQLKSSVKKEDFTVLLDGTNSDDLEESRPGLPAIRELNVATPLSDVGLNKNEIRYLARITDLSNHDLPSNSCLATRVPSTMNITRKLLCRISRAESFLQELGFSGCRVRPEREYAVIEVRRSDVQKISDHFTQSRVTSYFINEKFAEEGLIIRNRGCKTVVELIEFRKEQIIT
ncbi:MAG: ATP-dependent sacrificial sulfur transferase LarE [Deltaproteobacteria bacterium]|nr:ATP-dependent sacrificial sulfur transferase LarE [Deltaproteobacteria bacterium]